VTTLEEHQAIVREANLVAHTIHGGVSVSAKKCWQCRKDFITNDPNIMLCSDLCLSEYLLDRGIEWDPEATPEERWASNPAAIINSDTLLVLEAWAKKILTLRRTSS
jgi:hypothetical protein